MRSKSARQEVAERHWLARPVPLSALLWSCLACALFPPVAGFTLGDWMTREAALEAVDDRITQARVGLLAAFCVERVLDAPEARSRLAALESTEERMRAIVAAGLAAEPVSGRPAPQAAALCAARLSRTEIDETG